MNSTPSPLLPTVDAMAANTPAGANIITYAVNLNITCAVLSSTSSTNDVATLQKRNRDLYSDLDARIRKLEPSSVTVEGKSVQVDRDEQAAYESAMALFKANDFRTAVGGLS